LRTSANLRKTTAEERASDDAADPDFYEFADDFAHTWDGQWLLDTVLIDEEAGEAFYPFLNEVYPITGSYPLRMRVTDERLGRLAPVIRQIEEHFQISFVVERIFFNGRAYPVRGRASVARP
jgi:hypothetical protein